VTTQYDSFLKSKRLEVPTVGLGDIPELNPAMFPFQHDITAWALRRGRAAIFADCGLGKTIMQLEWARHVPGRVLVLAPLAVSAQIVREATKFEIPDVAYRRKGGDGPQITVTNYEMLDHFDPADYEGVVLDESSILKAYDGKTRNAIIGAFGKTPYRLACTATPAPNDFMELGNHCEFLGAMSRVEMLAMFFVHDGAHTQKWRLKRHAAADYWKWVTRWAVMLRKPSDLDYEDDGFTLPPLKIEEQVAATNPEASGALVPLEAVTLQEQIAARRETVTERTQLAAGLVNGDGKPWVIWCDLNAESAALAKAIEGAVEVRGSESNDAKERKLLDFSEGKIRVLVTKPSIAGHGMNWQHCNRMAFVGLSHSWEAWYQAVRRCWRFGQERPVTVHVITADVEGRVVANIKRKEKDADRMFDEMVNNTHELGSEAVHGLSRSESAYERRTSSGEGWTLHLGDCVEVLEGLDADSIHYTVFSPPFASLYTYSDSPRDMGNVRDGEEFAEHFRYAIAELFRATMPGRLVSFHCMNLPSSKSREGFIGLKDFRGELIRAFQEEGFIYHSEVCIWKDPVTAMQRTKALGLLYKQLRKDSAMSRQGIADYLVTMRKPGDNPERVTKTHDSFPVSLWQRYASPVWMDINQSDTLQHRSAREHEDERHIAPLQLEVIRRAVRLWSNPDDLILSPFAGIGSEGYVALEEGRRFVGIELKESYWKQAQANLKVARPLDLFGAVNE